MVNNILNITPLEAWNILKEDIESALIDVRTNFEWENIGITDLSSLNKNSYNISWRLYPNNIVNKDFTNFLAEKISNKKIKLLFICRSGGRSLEAASHAFQDGYNNCFNIINGFEGYSIDNNNQPGWKQYNLPWRYSN